MQHFNSFLKKHIDPTKRYGIACSGGGDSMALALLMLANHPPENLVILHFNHNLRPESAQEATWVQKVFHQKKVKTVVEKWVTLPPGNTMQNARAARYEFFAQQAQQLNLAGVLTAHTADDIAETFLMRLGKGSGLKGLAAMEETTTILNTPILRPLLNEEREALREYLKQQNQPWQEDPSNENKKYARPRVRQLKKVLEEAGIPFQSITASAFALQRASSAIQHHTNQFWQNAQISQTEIWLPDQILNLPKEVALQTLEKTILTLNPAPFAPRTSKRERMLKAMKNKNKHQAGGVQVCFKNKGFIFSKSPSR